MSVEDDFRALLAARSQLTALVGARIAQNAVPEGSPVPLVVFAVTHDRTLGLDNALLLDQCAISVQCWADNATEADAVADQVVLAVAGAPTARGACVVDRDATYDADLGLDGTLLTVEWWA